MKPGAKKNPAFIQTKTGRFSATFCGELARIFVGLQAGGVDGKVILNLNLLTNLPKCVLIHTMDSRKVIQLLKQNGWYEVARVGSHAQFRHPQVKGRVTVPHPKKDLPAGTLKSIERQAGIKFE